MQVSPRKQGHFNSQPHEEADGLVQWTPATDLYISTHSLTRRLTKSSDMLYVCKHISTHSLTRRLTHM